MIHIRTKTSTAFHWKFFTYILSASAWRSVLHHSDLLASSGSSWFLPVDAYPLEFFFSIFSPLAMVGGVSKITEGPHVRPDQLLRCSRVNRAFAHAVAFCTKLEFVWFGILDWMQCIQLNERANLNEALGQHALFSIHKLCTSTTTRARMVHAYGAQNESLKSWHQYLNLSEKSV